MAQVEGIQPCDLCAELPRHCQETGEELLVSCKHGRQGDRGGAYTASGHKCTAICRRQPPWSYTSVMETGGLSSLKKTFLALSHYKWQKWSWIIHLLHLLPFPLLTHLSLLGSERKGGKDTKWPGSHQAESKVWYGEVKSVLKSNF